MRDEDPELIGLSEVAELATVGASAVANWRARDPTFPEAIAELRSGPVFKTTQIRRYLVNRRKVRMNHVISTINLKGGVGKTTTTAALAEILAGEFNKRVLAIDLDPQTNLTTMLIGEDRWEELNDAGHTLATLFRDALRDESEPGEFDLEKTLQRDASPVQAVRTLDLLPSSLDLIDIQGRLGSITSGRFFANAAADLLRRAVKPVLPDYDYVLVDCPPNLGIVTLNGLRISDGYIIPTIPDILSTYGIPQIQRWVKAFATDIAEDIAELGILVAKFRVQATVHVNTVARLRTRTDFPPVFNQVVRETGDLSRSAEFTSFGTLRQRYGSAFGDYRAVAVELMNLLDHET